MKKILIITVTSGEGHNSIAKAVYNKLDKTKNQVVMVDLYKDFSTKFMFNLINDGYLLVCKHIPNVYNMFFKHFEKLNPNKRDKYFIHNTLKHINPKILNLIYTFEPDVVFMTHFYPSIILSNLKKCYPINAKLITVLTDYCVHPFWECAINIDNLILPSEHLTKILIEKGFKENQLLPLGLPVKQEFSNLLDKNQARTALNLNLTLPTVLLMQGGGGMGGNIKILKTLLKSNLQLQILCLNGKDTKSKNKIDKLIIKNKTNHKIINYGYQNNVDVLMSATDIIIGKCGCISVNETLNKNKPLLIYCNIVEQEKRNMEYLINKNAGIYCKTLNELLINTEMILKYKHLYNGVVYNIKQIKKPNALNNLCSLIENSKVADYSTIKKPNNLELKQVNKNIKKANKLKLKTC